MSLRGIVRIENSDKSGWREQKWSGDPLELKRPFRMTCCGTCGSGKTNFAWNVGLRRAATAKVDKNAWSRVVVWSPHGDEGEWSGADPTEFRKTLPAFDDSEYWGDIREPCLLVCDDVMLTRGALRKQYENVDKVFSFCSTHHNWSIILCCQELSQLDLNFKRFMSCWALWRPRDRIASIRLSSVVGLSKGDMERLLGMLEQCHDLIMIDSTGTADPAMLTYLCTAAGIRRVEA
jgi:hypothetical protein